MAVDEESLSRLHKFITIVIDWASGRLLHVAEGRGEKELWPFIRRLRRALKGTRYLMLRGRENLAPER